MKSTEKMHTQNEAREQRDAMKTKEEAVTNVDERFLAATEFNTCDRVH